MPLISVIIPVYNGEKTIRETIESVLNQTFSDFELIIINDSSEDATLDVIASFSDPRIRVFSYPKANQAVGRNRGIAHACGDYLAFLDADDLWTADKLAAQLDALLTNPQAAVAYSWTDFIDESSHFFGKGSHVAINGNVYARLLMSNFIDNGSNPLVKREAIAAVGDFNPSLPPAEDWDMWLRLAARYEFVAVPKPQILYRVLPNSMSTNVKRLETACLAIIQQAFAQAPPSLQPLKSLSLGNSYKYFVCKSLEGIPNQKKGFQAIPFLYGAVRYDPALLTTKIFWKVLFKITIVTLLPSQLAQMLLSKAGKIADIKTLYGYLRFEPS